VGVPLLAAAGARGRSARWVPALLATVLAVCHVVGYVIALGRYTVGTGQGLGLVDGDWAPPLPALVLVIAFAVTVTAWSVWLVRLGRVEATEPGPAPVRATGDSVPRP